MIAIDQDGHIAAGTSTNGLTHKVPGYAELARNTQKKRIYCICQFLKIGLALKNVLHNNFRFPNVLSVVVSETLPSSGQGRMPTTQLVALLRPEMET